MLQKHIISNTNRLIIRTTVSRDLLHCKLAWFKGAAKFRREDDVKFISALSKDGRLYLFEMDF